MAITTLRRPIWEMESEEELDAAIAEAEISDEEMERRHPELIWMRARAAEAFKDLQEKGILDENRRLIPPKELPEDMRPESATEC